MGCCTNEHDDGDLLRSSRFPVVGEIDVRSPLQGTVVSLEVAPGDVVRTGAVLMLIESMKMHHDVAASEHGRVVERARHGGYRGHAR